MKEQPKTFLNFPERVNRSFLILLLALYTFICLTTFTLTIAAYSTKGNLVSKILSEGRFEHVLYETSFASNVEVGCVVTMDGNVYVKTDYTYYIRIVSEEFTSLRYSIIEFNNKGDVAIATNNAKTTSGQTNLSTSSELHEGINKIRTQIIYTLETINPSFYYVETEEKFIQFKGEKNYAPLDGSMFVDGVNIFNFTVRKVSASANHTLRTYLTFNPNNIEDLKTKNTKAHIDYQVWVKGDVTTKNGKKETKLLPVLALYGYDGLNNINSNRSAVIPYSFSPTTLYVSIHYYHNNKLYTKDYQQNFDNLN